jgi:hypothetical protein
MKSCIVAGAGRSGTSLAAGVFRKAGYYYGDKLWQGTDSNPEGYFEDVEVNAINEDLMNQIVPWRPRGVAGIVFPFLHDRTRWGQRWLEGLPPDTTLPSTSRIRERIQAQTSHRPYLFKDPLFSYTLPLWRPHLADDTVFVCMFREPARTINSILKLCRDERYLRDLRMDAQRASDYWVSIYSYLLTNPEVSSVPWLFIHYDEILTGRAVTFLADRLEAEPDFSMLRPELRRSGLSGEVPSAAADVYAQLLEQAETKYASS